MCLAIPGTITKIEDMEAYVDYGGVSKCADIRLVENVKVGDIVLVHAGFVIQILDKENGEELQKLVEETMGIIYK
jgi:hydrogenase expression/formation protein HypC